MIIKRFFLLVFCIIGITSYSQNVSVKVDMPEKASPGQEFTITIEIVKNNITDFAKVQQVLPEGFRALQKETAGSTFSFQEQKVKYLWLSLPSDPTFKISYTVVVEQTVLGQFQIPGSFSYIENNKTKKIDFPVKNITIEGTVKEVAQNVQEMKVIEEKQKEEETKEAVADNKVVNRIESNVKSPVIEPPVEEEVYTPPVNETIKDARENVSVPETEVKYRVEDQYVAQQKQDEPYIPKKANVNTTVNPNQPQQERVTPTTRNQYYPPQSNTSSNSKYAYQNTPLGGGSNNNVSYKASSYDKTASGISFKVQIAASESGSNASSLQSKYNIQQNVSVDNEDGKYKYVVGNFSTYNEAKQYAKNCNVEGAFVVGYDNGRRIKSGEALNLISQRSR